MKFQKALPVLFVLTVLLLIGWNIGNAFANQKADLEKENVQTKNDFAEIRKEWKEAREKFKEQYDKLSENEQKEVKEKIADLHEKLFKLGIHVPLILFEKQDKKEKIKQLIRDVSEGKIPVEEAEKQVDNLFSNKIMKKSHRFENLDDETKQKAKEIWQQMREGTISKEKGKQQLADLGITSPKKKQIDEESKQKAMKYVQETKTILEKYNIDFPVKIYEKCINK